MTSPLAIGGSHRSRCSSEPKRWIGNMQSEPWTETKDRKPLSAYSSSRHASP